MILRPPEARKSAGLPKSIHVTTRILRGGKRSSRTRKRAAEEASTSVAGREGAARSANPEQQLGDPKKWILPAARGGAALTLLDLSPTTRGWISNLHNGERVLWCCFKPLYLCTFVRTAKENS